MVLGFQRREGEGGKDFAWRSSRDDRRSFKRIRAKEDHAVVRTTKKKRGGKGEPAELMKKAKRSDLSLSLSL